MDRDFGYKMDYSLNVKKLTPQKFHRQKQLWKKAVYPVDDCTTDKITFVTYNIWFARYYRQERCQALLNIIRDCHADAIALQEVTPETLKIILAQEWIRDSYYVSDATGKTISPYGVLLLSRLPIRQLFLHQLISFMSRQALVADISINNQIIRLAIIHLESRKPSAPIRAQQLAAIFPMLQDSDRTILMGDFNFCSSWQAENAQIDSSYQDLWTLLKPDEPGYTEDTDINLMRLEQKGKKRHVRFDRILFRCNYLDWYPYAVELLGTEPISPDLSNVFPSDHFGVCGTIEWRWGDGVMG